MIDFGSSASSNARQAVSTSLVPVLLAKGIQCQKRASERYPLTRINVRHAVVDQLFGMRLECFRHVRKGWNPLEGIAQVSMRAYRAQVAAVSGDVWM